MLFRFLGPLEIRAGDGWHGISAAKLRALLAALLLRLGEVVPSDLLVDELWADAAPAGARKLVSGYVLRLRRLIGDTGGRVLVTRAPGYQLLTDPAELDARRFVALLGDGRAALAACDTDRAVELLDEALSLWRGPALVDVPAGALPTLESDRLGQLRLEAIELRAEAAVAAGRCDRAIDELRRLTAAHPLRERTWMLLMRALQAGGWQAEALDVYARARQIITDELGAEPCTEFQRLYRRVLDGDRPPAALVPAARSPLPDAPSPAPPAAVPPRTEAPARLPVVPRQLPAPVRHLAGRDAALCRLTELVGTSPRSDGGAVVVSAIAGTAGVGKTALAVYWAHQVAAGFPDGQLYVNLRGFDPSGLPVTPAEAVRGFLDAFGVPDEQIPVSLDAQVGLYRSLLAGRRVLVLLDNARDCDQVRPLLPSSPGCLAMITSRAELTGLAAVDGAQVLSLDVLTAAGARDLLDRYLGADRLAAEPAVADALVELCAGLPLALRVVAARAATRPQLPLTQLVASLRDARGRLDALDAGNPRASARAVFSWSFQVLSPSTAQLFCLLGLHPGPHITVPAAAALAGLPAAATRTALRELTRAHLTSEWFPGQFGMHDLLRAYAVEQAESLLTVPGRRAALRRMLDHYLHTARQAARLLGTAREFTALPAVPGAAPEPLADATGAWAWFEAEHQVLATVARAESVDTGPYGWQIPWAVADFLDRRGYWHEYAAMARCALATARRLDDRDGLAASHREMGHVHSLFGRYDEARASYRAAARLHGESGDRIGEAHAYRMTGVATGLHADYREALDHAERALRLYEACDHRRGQADVLNDIGWYRAHLGDAQAALRYCRSALAMQQELGNRHGAADAWDSLGYASHRLGDHPRARDCYRQALLLYRELDARHFEADTYVRLGETCRAGGDRPAAQLAWRHALAILDAMRHPQAARLRRRLAALDQQTTRSVTA